MTRRHHSITIAALALLGMAAPAAHAASIGLDWLQMSSVNVGNTVPTGSVFNLPGVGPVVVTYSMPTFFNNSRGINPLLQSGNVTFGPDNYNWTNHEYFGAVNTQSANPVVAVPWRITYTFPTTLPANSVYVGVAGLGATTSFGGGNSTASVNQNGTFLGDWTGGGNYGATQYTGGPGTSSMQNSVTGAGGIDPWWNSALGVVQINDAVSSITINLGQLAGDGVGVNIAYHAVPAPGAACVLGLSGLVAMRRRRGR